MLQAWPPGRRTHYWNDNKWLGLRSFPIQAAPKFVAPVSSRSNDLRQRGMGARRIQPMSHQRSYSNKVNKPMTNGRVFPNYNGALRMALSGITRDSAGAALGNCRVMIFRTEDMSFVGELTSDGSGAWLLDMMKGGPFFRVAYKVGSPDVAGTSRNDIVPVQILI
jgi:hypothetical protein